jgi:hypothetical protein
MAFSLYGIAQKTQLFKLINSSSASNGGLQFSTDGGDTMLYCPNHPDVFLEGKKEHSLYKDGGGPELNPQYSGKHFMVTYTVTDTSNGDGDEIVYSGTATKLVMVPEAPPAKPTHKPYDKLIADIDKKTEKIKTNIPKLKEIDKEESSSGYTHAYAKGKDLQYISVYFKSGKTSRQFDYYYSGGHIIYTEQIIRNDATKIENKEKIYVNNSRPIVWLKADNTATDTNSQEFKKIATDIPSFEQQQLKKYTPILNAQKK